MYCCSGWGMPDYVDRIYVVNDASMDSVTQITEDVAQNDSRADVKTPGKSRQFLPLVKMGGLRRKSSQTTKKYQGDSLYND